MITRLLWLVLCTVASLLAQQASIGGVNVDGRWVVAPQYASPAPQIHQQLPPPVLHHLLRSPPAAAARQTPGDSVVKSYGGSLYLNRGTTSATSAPIVEAPRQYCQGCPIITGVTVSPGVLSYGPLGQRGNAMSDNESLKVQPAPSVYVDPIIVGQPKGAIVTGRLYDRVDSQRANCVSEIYVAKGTVDNSVARYNSDGCLIVLKRAPLLEEK